MLKYQRGCGSGDDVDNDDVDDDDDDDDRRFSKTYVHVYADTVSLMPALSSAFRVP